MRCFLTSILSAHQSTRNLELLIPATRLILQIHSLSKATFCLLDKLIFKFAENTFIVHFYRNQLMTLIHTFTHILLIDLLSVYVFHHFFFVSFRQLTTAPTSSFDYVTQLQWMYSLLIKYINSVRDVRWTLMAHYMPTYLYDDHDIRIC